MKSTTTTLSRTILLSLLILATSGLVQAASITWKVVISPKGGGTVQWRTSSPAASGTLTNSGSLKFDSGAYVDLTFKAQAGYQLTSVFKNIDIWTPYLDGNSHYQFGPVGGAHVIAALFSVITPSGTFKFDFPDGKATTVADVTGNYKGITTKNHRNYNADVAMDEAGKLSAIGTVDGIVPKSGGPIQGSGGSIKTVNNQPTAQLKGAFAGTKDGVTTTASGTCNGPLTVQDTGDGKSVAGGLGSGTAKVGDVTSSLKPTATNFTVSAAQKANLTKSWNMSLTISENVNAKTGKRTLAASAILTLPSGDKTFFKEKTVTYTVKSGYTIAFSKGVKLDAVGNQMIDPKTGKPALDTKSAVAVTQMLITGSPGHWTVTDGTMTYSFLGQKGKGNVTDFSGEEETLLNNWNIYGVADGPTAPTTFAISKSYVITYLNSYHWNSGQGTTAPGQLSLRHQDGTIYGPWNTTGSPGQGGVPNAVWECSPGVVVKAGAYTVLDSSPATWSQNSASGGQGFAKVLGKP